MTHAVLLFKEADDSLVTHILGWGGSREGGWVDVGDRSQDKQTTYMDVNHKYTDRIPYAAEHWWGGSVCLHLQDDVSAVPATCDFGHVRQTVGAGYEMM